MAECPYCAHPLSEPGPAYCPGCGRQLLAVPPALPSSPAPRSSATGTPWERRGEIGIGTALVETTQQVLLSPEVFFRSMPTTGGILDPLLYGLIIGYVGLVAATLYNAVFRATFGSALAGFGGRPEFARIAPFLQSGAGLVVNLIMGPIFIAVGLFISAGILHLLLMLLSGGARGFEATFRVVAYATASHVIQILPLCGGPIGAVYTLVLLIIGLSAAHGDSKGKTAVAVLIPIFLCCCCCAFGIVTLAGGIASIANRFR